MREGTSYKKVVENLQKELYVPYTITAKALRLFINSASVYYKCKAISSSNETSKQRKEVKAFKLHATWSVTSDQNVPDIKQHLEYFNNGCDYILAMKPRALCEVNESKNNLMETLIESQNYLKTLKDIVPDSEVKSTLKVIESHITTALNLTKSTHFTSGAAEITFSDVPQPVVSSRGASPRKRRCHSSESQEDSSEIGKCLGENQCSCGKFFEDRKSLDIHIKAVHLPSNWSCSHQSSSKYGHPYPKRYSLWKHIHTHHLNTWNYHCKM